MELLVRLILCRDGLFIAGMWPSVVNLKVGDTFLIPSEWCMIELEPGTSAERSIGEKSGVEPRDNRLIGHSRLDQSAGDSCDPGESARPIPSWSFQVP